MPITWLDQTPIAVADAAPSSQSAPARVRSTRTRRARSNATYDASVLTPSASTSISSVETNDCASEGIACSGDMGGPSMPPSTGWRPSDIDGGEQDLRRLQATRHGVRPRRQELAAMRSGRSVEDERLRHQRCEAADVLVELFLARLFFHQRLDARLEVIRHRAFDEDVLLRELVDDLEGAAADLAGAGTAVGSRDLEEDDGEAVRVVEHVHGGLPAVRTPDCKSGEATHAPTTPAAGPRRRRRRASASRPTGRRGRAEARIRTRRKRCATWHVPAGTSAPGRARSRRSCRSRRAPRGRA